LALGENSMLHLALAGFLCGSLSPTVAERTFAASLTLADVDDPIAVPSEAEWPRLVAALRVVAIDMELVSSAESGLDWLLVGNSRFDFPDRVRWMRRRSAEFGEAPSIVVLGRFPPGEMAAAFVGFNRSYREWLSSRMEWEPDRKADYEVVAGETDDLYRPWQALYIASQENWSMESRRKALADLKRLLDEDFEYGRMPDYIPRWRFNER